MNKKIILASRSKARRALLKQMGLRFRVIKPEIKERRSLRTKPEDLVVGNAVRKARDVARRLNTGIVIGADTVVMSGRKMISKPKNIKDAFRTLKSITKRPQWVYTGLAVVDARTGKYLRSCVKTKVYMRPLNDKQIRDYFKKVSPLDKAGSFDIQGLGGVFVKRIEGCFYNVVGLPIAALAHMLDESGIDVFSST